MYGRKAANNGNGTRAEASAETGSLRVANTILLFKHVSAVSVVIELARQDRISYYRSSVSMLLLGKLPAYYQRPFSATPQAIPNLSQR
jgi:hypothetical protein